MPNIEIYEYVPEVLRRRDPWPRTPHPDILNYGLRDYGNRVGFWRLLDVLDGYAIKCTTSLNIACYREFPEIMEACETRGWDTMCHGMYNTRYHYDLTREEEAAEIAACVDTFRELTGRSFSGWFSPADSGSLITPDLVAEAGIKYFSDWYHDDQPGFMNVSSGRLLTVPYSMDVNDGWNLRQNFDADEFARCVVDQFDQLYLEGAESGRVFCLPIHPYVFGQPHRIRVLDDLLKYILSHDGVWQATGLEIAKWYEHSSCSPQAERS